MKKLIIILLSCLPCCLVATKSIAQTVTKPAVVKLLSTGATFARDRAVGTAQGRALASANTGYLTPKGFFKVDYTTTFTVNGALVPGYTNVYTTNNPSIGVRFLSSKWESVGTQYAAPFVSTGQRSGADGTQVSVNFDVSAEFVVVSTPIQPGPVQSASFPTAHVRIARVSNGDLILDSDVSIVVGSGINFTANTCDVLTPSISFNMPTVSVAAFNTAPASAPMALNIDLNCQAGITTYMTVSDASNPDNQSAVLSLEPNATAKGVGYNVLYQGSPVLLGADSAIAGNLHQFKVATGVSGKVSVPLSIQYVKTQGAVQPGSANAIATFTMSYQ